MKAPTERFSNRVENYVRYRPAYPKSLVDTLIHECHLEEDSIVADIGSGTGIFSRQLLEDGFQVFAVEPNQEMREASEKFLSGYEEFTSIGGRAEKTTLPNNSVDFVAASQAFHWFQCEKAQREFARILRPDGWVALIWNQRDMRQKFQKDYDALLMKYAPEYASVNHMNISTEQIADFFSAESYQHFVFENHQIFDQSGFLGRMRSSSYISSTGCPDLWESAKRLFSQHSADGTISFGYEAMLHIGRIKGQ